ncbi:FkbM family methyltransferase [Opitutales bacterium]|nr:FkbM family methyltransferase [Opitutales bacterium]
MNMCIYKWLYALLAAIHPQRKARKDFRRLKNDLKSISSYSQEGEDLILQRILNHPKEGFYIDVGAHHPFRFSNTALLYKRKWRGINIEANPSQLESFKRYRPRDINLNLLVGNQSKEIDFYFFNDSALNTSSPEIAQNLIDEGKFKFLKKEKVIPWKLEEIINKFAPEITNIDYLNIDVEGLGLSVLESNNWNKHSPSVISIELLSCNDFEQLKQFKEYLFLKEKGYSLEAKTPNTAFFTKL